MREVIKITQKDIVNICTKYITEYSDKGTSIINEQQSTYFDVNQLDNVKQVDNFDKVYSYAKGYDPKKKIFRYAFKKQGDLNWKEVTQAVNPKAYTAIKQNVFKEKPTATKDNAVLKSKVPVQQQNPFTQDLANRSDTYAPIRDTAKLNADIGTQQFLDWQKGIVGITKDSSTQLHIRMFEDFMLLRSKVFTTKDLTKEEIKVMLTLINFQVQRKQFKNNQSFSFYEASNKYLSTQQPLNNPNGKGVEQIKFKAPSLGIDQMDVKNKSTDIALSLGNAYVKDDGSNFIISDQYDFNNYYNHPENYTFKTFPITFINGIKKIIIPDQNGNRNYVQGIEEIVSIIQKGGYKGYPVNIVIPKNLV